MIGPIVRDISRTFDEYWNSAAAYPMQLLHPQGVTKEALEKFRVYLVEHRNEESVEHYMYTLAADEDVQHLIAGEWPMQWSGKYSFRG